MRLPSAEAESDGPNMTPVIDMVFLLLIFFLCATRFDQEEKDMTAILPEVVQAQPTSTRPEEVVVNITHDGQFIVQQKKVTEAQLADLLHQMSLKNPGTQSVLIRGDARSQWEVGIRVMGLCNRAGIRDYRVAVIEER